MNLRFKSAAHQSRGLSLVELLVALAIVSGLALGVGFAVDYFQKQSAIANSENQLSLEAQNINAKLAPLFVGGNKLEVAAGYGSPSGNGNYCYKIESTKPVSFSSTDISNGAVFEYRVAARTASTSPARTQQNSEPKLASTASLGLPTDASLASNFPRRTLSMWVKLSNVAANDRVLFEYSPDVLNTSSYKMVVRVMGGNTIRVDMGMGLTEFIYNVPNIRNGAWHHLVVDAGNLSMAGSSPVLYVDGTKVSVEPASVSGSATNFVPNLNYKINIGDSASAKWSLGPVGLWNRALTSAEIAKLGRMESVNVNNAFWLPAPTANLSTSPTNVTNGSTINARPESSYLLFKKDSLRDGRVYYKMYKIDQAVACVDPAAADDPSLQGFESISEGTCAAPSSTLPLVPDRVPDGSLGFKWNCNLSDGKREAAATDVSAGSVTGAILKSSEACQIPISADEFKTTESTNTAFLMIDDFDPLIDLLTIEGNDFPDAMPNTSTTSGLNIARPSNISSDVNSIVWYGDVDNSVGMYKITTSEIKPKLWWVDNVFKKIKYKPRSEIYNSERSLVFSLGDAWPIKVCPNLGYKSKYHFYKVVSHSNPVGSSHAQKMLSRYTRPFADNQQYFGMSGYLANMRCPNEKDQIARRVFVNQPGNSVQATLGMWAVYQDVPGPKILRQQNGNCPYWYDDLGRAQRVCIGHGGSYINSNYGTFTNTVSRPNFAVGREYWDAASQQRQPQAWQGEFFNGYTESEIEQTHNSGFNPVSVGQRIQTNGTTTWRIIGGAKTDHNVIVLSDHTLCDGTSQAGYYEPGASFAGCQGVTTVTLPSNASSCAVAGAGSPQCLLQNQVGGNRQYNWWKPRFTSGHTNWSVLAGEPNKSGTYIWMGYNPIATQDTDYWDDKRLRNQEPKDLIEYGDHPYDAGLPVDSAYRAALRRDNSTAITSTTIANEDHDPPNMVSKKIKSVNAFYCK